MAAYANLSYSGMLSAILEAAKDRYGLGNAEKIEISRKISESVPRKSPVEYAAEFEDGIEAINSLDSENTGEPEAFSEISESIQAFEGI